MIVQVKDFNIQKIADSGQCFRMEKLGENLYCNVAYGRYIEIKQLSETEIDVSCSKHDWDTVWFDYFDLDYDYLPIYKSIIENKKQDMFMYDAAYFSYGIRILNQPLFETLISFIISQRKNIPAIKSCINKLCEKYGYKRYDTNTEKYYYTFPRAEKMIELTDDLGLGYRKEYIEEACKLVITGELNLSALYKMNYEQCLYGLKQLTGVGDKVANCVILFAGGHKEAFPIDVWIQRIIDNEYNGVFDSSRYSGYAGVIQQFMFYYYRSLH